MYILFSQSFRLELSVTSLEEFLEFVKVVVKLREDVFRDSVLREMKKLGQFWSNLSSWIKGKNKFILNEAVRKSSLHDLGSVGMYAFVKDIMEPVVTNNDGLAPCCVVDHKKVIVAVVRT